MTQPLLRMTPKEEYDLFLQKCKKEKVKATPHLFTVFQENVRRRLSAIEEFSKTDEFKVIVSVQLDVAKFVD